MTPRWRGETPFKQEYFHPDEAEQGIGNAKPSPYSHRCQKSAYSRAAFRGAAAFTPAHGAPKAKQPRKGKTRVTNESGQVQSLLSQRGAAEQLAPSRERGA